MSLKEKFKTIYNDKKKFTKLLSIGFLCLLIITFVVVIIVSANQNPQYRFLGAISNTDKTFIEVDQCSDVDLNDTIEKLEINNGGAYHLTGTINNTIEINSPKEKVFLLLDNVIINTNDSPAIICTNAKKLVITLAENSINTINCNYTNVPETNNGAIYSSTDCVINGLGQLEINTYNVTAIHASDDLIIYGANLIIDAQSDTQGSVRGIKVNDQLLVEDLYLDITSNGDGIKSEDDVKDNSVISIISGEISIQAKGDGIQAKNRVEIKAGSLSITAGYNTTSSKGIKSDELIYIIGGTINIKASIDKGLKANDIYIDGGEITISAVKGIDADDSLFLVSGSINITSTQKAINSMYTTIENIELEISAKGKGISASEKITINGGNINITNSSEGMEAPLININDGTIKIVANDDGININCVPHDMMGNTYADQKASGKLTITGGMLYIKAAGDGIDSNDEVSVSGGIVLVDGPSDNGNGALDYDTSFKVSGDAIVIAVGGSGMAQAPSSSKGHLSVKTSSSISANTLISITDSNGNLVMAYIPKKSLTSIVYASNKLSTSKTYTISTGGKIEGEPVFMNYYESGTVTGAKKLTTSTPETSSSDTGFGGGGQMGPGGQNPGGRRVTYRREF